MSAARAAVSRKPARRKLVSFKCTQIERALIGTIAARAVRLGKEFGRTVDPVSTAMDVTATHANGNPLRLADLLAADDFNFMHDVFGIYRHLDRDTGKLGNCFSPRFSRRSER